MDSDQSLHLTTSPSIVSERSLPFDYAACVGGLSDPSTHQYQGRRRVLELTNQLHSYGLQHQLDLPQIAVVGIQSVGKSSLIESIAGIKLPRAAGTCTRCPIYCQLQRSDSPWSCSVYLRMHGMTDKQFGPPLADKSKVEDRIRRAQLAILNPSMDTSDFLGPVGVKDSRMRNEHSFSTNWISVRISGEGVNDDLSFVDLPGLIASVKDGEEDSDIEKVRNLVLDVIKKPSCLILSVVSGETDLENQGGHSLLKRVDQLGTRTIQVLTKPDRIDGPEGEKYWLNIMSKRQQASEHGWYCVKQSDQQQLAAGISWARSRENEENFFATQEPWRSLPNGLKSRLGTASLTRALGGNLFDLIRKRLPGLLNEVKAKLQDIKKEIAALPQIPTADRDSLATLMNLLEAFKQDVQQLVKGRPEDGQNGLIQTFREQRGRFREAILRQAPDFQVYDNPKQANAVVPSESSRQAVFPASNGFSSTLPVTSMLEQDSGSALGKDSSRVVYLDDVSKYAKRAITRELPRNHPYAVKVHFITRFTEGWEGPAKELLDSIDGRFSKELRHLVNRHFSPFAPGELDKAVMESVLAQLNHCRARVLGRMDECITLEKEEPTTSNEDTLIDYRHRFHALYTEARQLHLKKAPNIQRFLSGAFDTDLMPELFGLLKQMGLSHITKEHLVQSLPIDDTDNAIEIMSEVRAYYELAFRRFVDNIPRIIDFELLKGVSRSIGTGSKLFQGILPGEDDIHGRCTAFLKEDPEVLRSRKTLNNDFQRLTAALTKLEAISAVDLGVDNESERAPIAIFDEVHTRPPSTPPYEPGFSSIPPGSPIVQPGPPRRDSIPPGSPMVQPGSPQLEPNHPIISEDTQDIFSFNKKWLFNATPRTPSPQPILLEDPVYDQPYSHPSPVLVARPQGKKKKGGLVKRAPDI